MSTIYTLVVQHPQGPPSVTVHPDLADLGERLVEEWGDGERHEFRDDEEGIDGLMRLIGGKYLATEFTWDSHEVDVRPAPFVMPKTLIPTEQIVTETLAKLGEEWDLDEDFPCEDAAQDYGEIRHTVTHVWMAVSEILEKHELPALTTCWDANADGQLDGWAMMITVYHPLEQYSFGAWGDDGDTTMDSEATGEAAARGYVENVLHHYELLLGKAVRLGLWTPA